MKVRLNDKELEIDTNQQKLLSLMQAHNLYHESGIAVAINEEIVPRQQWDNHTLQEKDNILIITATQGG